ncbi:hypothetical protein BC940DRAFT_332183 [Gongronella butleri]|nr:hypothetical protein BC940DRAFT_332183 [Gongronella butleri]
MFASVRALLWLVILRRVLFVDASYHVGEDLFFNAPYIAGAASTSLNGSVYVYGGITKGYSASYSNVLYKIDFPAVPASGGLIIQNISTDAPVTGARLLTLPDKETLALLGGDNAALDNSTLPLPVQPLYVAFYHIPTSKWTHPNISTANPALYPPNRADFGAAVAPNGLIYLIAGNMVPYNSTLAIQLTDFWSFNYTSNQFVNLTISHYDDNAVLYYATGQSLTALSNGTLISLGGYYPDYVMQNLRLHPYTYSRSGDFVYSYDTTRANASWNMLQAAGSLYPNCYSIQTALNDTTIAIFGGDNCNMNSYETVNQASNNLTLLDLGTLAFYSSPVNGVPPLPRARHYGGFLDATHLLVAGGLFDENIYLNDFNVLQLNSANSGPQWLETFDQSTLDNAGGSGLTPGQMAAVIVCVLIGMLLIGLFFWRFGKYVKFILLNLHHDIWRPRTGEPLWTETTRVISQVILFFLFLIFFVYIVIQVRDSPLSTITINQPVSAVAIPNVRICIEGGDGFAPNVICTYDNATSCIGNLEPLDLNVHRPGYSGLYSNLSCWHYQSGNDMLTSTSQTNPGFVSATKVIFDVYVYASATGVVHVDAFHPESDPINVVYFNRPVPTLTQDAVTQWRVNDINNVQVDNSVQSHLGGDTVITYQLQTLKQFTSSSWNVVGIVPQYNSTPSLTTLGRTTLVNASATLDITNVGFAGRVFVRPASMMTVVLQQQRIYSVLTALSYLGGLFSLFLAIQTLLFGYRPSSPWGIVHRWSVGEMKRSISQGLVRRFQTLRTPVPLVNPVHRRFSLLDIQSYGYRHVGPLHGADYEGDDDDDDGEKSGIGENELLSPLDNDEGRLTRMEDRLQLLELLFKSYYINDEVFQSLDRAIKRQKRRVARQTRQENDMHATNGTYTGTSTPELYNQPTKRRSWLPSFARSSGSTLHYDPEARPPTISPLRDPSHDFHHPSGSSTRLDYPPPLEDED